jgi:predicted nucleic acid-binding OB-fold protein
MEIQRKILSHILTQMRHNRNRFISFQEMKKIVLFTKIHVGGMEQGQT